MAGVPGTTYDHENLPPAPLLRAALGTKPGARAGPLRYQIAKTWTKPLNPDPVAPTPCWTASGIRPPRLARARSDALAAARDAGKALVGAAELVAR